MKRIIGIVALVALVFAVGSGSVWAYGLRNAERIPFGCLELTDTQREAIDELVLPYRAQLEAMREERQAARAEGDFAEARALQEEAMAYRQEFRAQLRATLTPEQQEALDAQCAGPQNVRQNRQEQAQRNLLQNRQTRMGGRR